MIPLRPARFLQLALLFSILGCAKRSKPAQGEPERKAAPARPHRASRPSPRKVHQPRAVHRHGHHRHGDLHRPWSDSRKYISFLDRPGRARWQKPDKVVKALGLAGKKTVLDIGAGSGYFTFRFARALPQGKVVAADLDPAMLKHIRDNAHKLGLENVQTLLFTKAGPTVPKETDLVFICNTLHHVENPGPWLAKLFAGLKRGALLVVIEFYKKKLPVGPPPSGKLKRSKATALVTAAGFSLSRQDLKLLPYQYMLVFKKP